MAFPKTILFRGVVLEAEGEPVESHGRQWVSYSTRDDRDPYYLVERSDVGQLIHMSQYDGPPSEEAS